MVALELAALSAAPEGGEPMPAAFTTIA